MGRDMPPWPALEAFMAAAQSGSFKEAAEHLNLSAPALTRRIQTLEHHVGARLFDRKAQRARLTAAGRHYAECLRPGFESLRTAMADLRPDAHARPLRLRISHSLAILWLTPRLPRFFEKHPGIDLQLQSAGTRDGLEAGIIDVGIFFSREPLEGLAAAALFQLDSFIVAAPQLLDRPLPRLEDLASDTAAWPLLDLTDPGAAWPEWLRASGCADLEAHTRVLFDSIQAMYQAASAGLGLALGFNPLVDPFLRDGQLRIVGEQRHRMAGAYYVVTTRRALQQKAVRALWHWIAREGRVVASALGQASELQRGFRPD
jgi:LysR family transcriptional regulator, glycine cleavage system transcriptional activator